MHESFLRYIVMDPLPLFKPCTLNERLKAGLFLATMHGMETSLAGEVYHQPCAQVQSY